MHIIITTLNCNDLNDEKKIYELRDIINQTKSDILFLQETHVNKNEKLYSDYEIKSMLCDDATKGVAIFVKKNRLLKINNILFDDENRVIGMNVNMKEINIDLITIYAPNKNDEQLMFIENYINS
jgi:exonuclease III